MTFAVLNYTNPMSIKRVHTAETFEAARDWLEYRVELLGRVKDAEILHFEMDSENAGCADMAVLYGAEVLLFAIDSGVRGTEHKAEKESA